MKIVKELNFLGLPSSDFWKEELETAKKELETVKKELENIRKKSLGTLQNANNEAVPIFRKGGKLIRK